MRCDVTWVVWHCMCRCCCNVRIQIGTRICPVGGRSRKNAARRGWYTSMGTYEVQLWTMMIPGHEQIWLVLVGGICRCRLCRLRKSLEIELVRVPFTMHLGHYVLVVVISKRTAEFVVVHVGLAFSLAPSSRHFIRISQLEFPICAFPRDAVGVAAVGK